MATFEACEAQLPVDQTVEGTQVHGCSIVEFALHQDQRRICIVEAKNEHFDQAVAQLLVKCDAVAETEVLATVHSTVATYTEWIFFRRMDEKIQRHEASIFRSDNILTQATVEAFAEKIHAMLSEDVNPVE